jgi:hypothetical protein
MFALLHSLTTVSWLMAHGSWHFLTISHFPFPILHCVLFFKIGTATSDQCESVHKWQQEKEKETIGGRKKKNVYITNHWLRIITRLSGYVLKQIIQNLSQILYNVSG